MYNERFSIFKGSKVYVVRTKRTQKDRIERRWVKKSQSRRRRSGAA